MSLTFDAWQSMGEMDVDLLTACYKLEILKFMQCPKTSPVGFSAPCIRFPGLSYVSCVGFAQVLEPVLEICTQLQHRPISTKDVTMDWCSGSEF